MPPFLRMTVIALQSESHSAHLAEGVATVGYMQDAYATSAPVRLPARNLAGATTNWALVVLLALSGCRSSPSPSPNDLAHYQSTALAIEYPKAAPAQVDPASYLPPRTLKNHEQIEYWDLPLEEALHLALANSKVMRDIGGRVVARPTQLSTIYDPAIRETDPQFGTEAALSQFDAQLSGLMNWQKNDRIYNNFFAGGGVGGPFEQDLANFRIQIDKRAATGTQFAVRHNVDYDLNNSPFNRFPSAYNVNVEVEARQPFLQGGGIDFNRIAGPNSYPGVYRGVVISRINTDITLADFEAGVINLVQDVERNYWELAFAYRDLNAKIAGREASLQTWRSIQRKRVVGAAGGDEESEARAREQYFWFTAEVENALSGTRLSGELVARVPGVYVLESRLRLLLGLPPNDGRLIRPSDEPTAVELLVDWEHSLNEALLRRVELRRQQWTIKRRELELIAARNYLKPRLDGVAIYRWRGFGNDLLDPSATGNPPLQDAYQNMTSGDFQEWFLGVEGSVPIGNRIGHVTVRNAELQLIRDQALLEEQQRHVVHELGTAVTELDRGYQVTRTYNNRRIAAHQQYEAIQRKYEAGTAPLDEVLRAQQRVADSESNYYRALLDYNLANMYYHVSQGTLLDYDGVELAEGDWPFKAYSDAARKTMWFRPTERTGCRVVPAPVSAGVYDQGPLPRAAAPTPAADYDTPPAPTLEHLPDPT